MDRVILPNGRATSRIGFGCGSLRGGSDSAASRALLVAALDAGIRHFDLAPPYGLGLAEDVAGGVLAPLSGEITITTKAGIGRPKAPGLLTGIRKIAKPALAGFPALWQAAASRVRMVASTRGNFAPEFVLGSVADSLRRLRIDSVDILLMHEMRDADVTADLLGVLDDLKTRGVAGALGTGGRLDDGCRIAADYPMLGQVMQFRWNVFDSPLDAMPAALCITHGAIDEALGRMVGLTKERREAAMVWSIGVDADLEDPRQVCDLLLAAALAENPDGIVLVASQNPLHISRAADVAANPSMIAKGARLRDLVRERANPAFANGAEAAGTVLDGSGAS